MHEEGLSKLKYQVKFRMTILFVIFLLIAACFVPLSSSQLLNQNPQVNQNPQASSKAIDGQILYSPMYSGTTYLRDSTGALNHTWSSSFLPGCMVRGLGDGSILRTIRVGAGPGGGGAGGGVQKVEWDGTVVWDFRYNSNGDLSHHDVQSLPNGNVLLIAWETKTRTECIAAGMEDVPHNGLVRHLGVVGVGVVDRIVLPLAHICGKGLPAVVVLSRIVGLAVVL